MSEYINTNLTDLHKSHLLLKLHHDVYGDWYFTNMNLAARFLGKRRSQLEWAYLKKHPHENWTIEVVDGIDVSWNVINWDPDALAKLIEEYKIEKGL